LKCENDVPRGEEWDMQSTRQRILEILNEKKQATVEQLSAELDLTPVTVRHHLEVLRGEGLVSAPQVLRRSGPGRPQYAYGLTEAAGDFFPKNYHRLADLILDEIREQLSENDIKQVMERVADRMAQQGPSLGRERRPQEILGTIVGYLNDQGYAARWERNPSGEFVLHTCNCPYERVAQTHSEICQMDASFVARLVGAAPRRTSHMASGDAVCSYVLRFDENTPDK
jgi:predicted ArsR family transcriptional regulator